METLELDVSRLPAIGLSRVFCQLSRILPAPFKTMMSMRSSRAACGKALPQLMILA